ncbi:hypothetical protein HHL23_20250 [Chryseobacterium sp. RP-3-3]|uniref:Uncharacterized protein n=1 Tax=Chryseobacterium antibioticum TaxID=2728847 RepID=A0A7Y0FTB1_9FLAO|nr:hypothetical protein [Chryseobacterium antibioticum]NML72103.1 hypothetical protein [Chryseobacterium antibioticum]
MILKRHLIILSRAFSQTETYDRAIPLCHLFPEQDSNLYCCPQRSNSVLRHLLYIFPTGLSVFFPVSLVFFLMGIYRFETMRKAIRTTHFNSIH